MTTASSPNDRIRDLEEQLLRPEVRGSPDAVGALLDDAFVEFATDGRAYTKAQVIAALQRESAVYERSLTDFRARPLADGVILATYRATRRDASGEVVESLRSSVWTRRSGDWRILFHQGTRVGS